MLDFQFNPDSMSVPGYLGFQRLLNISVDLRGAFSHLEIYEGRDAEDFIRKRVERMVPPHRVEDVTDLCLAFAVMSVVADREERGEYEDGPPPPEAFEAPQPGSEADAEREQTERVRF